MSGAAALLAHLPPSLAGGRVWRGSQLARSNDDTLATGFAALDAELPGAGWPRGALIELLLDHPGVGELSLLLPALSRTAATHWIVLVAPPLLPYAPALAAAGVPLARLLLVRPQQPGDILWATRQAAAAGSCAAVLAWPDRLDHSALRRLQLAAAQGATPLFLFRPRAAAQQASPAPLRLALEPAGTQLCVRILKRRGPPCAQPLLLPVRGDAVGTAWPASAAGAAGGAAATTAAAAAAAAAPAALRRAS